MSDKGIMAIYYLIYSFSNTTIRFVFQLSLQKNQKNLHFS
jgi:hypothetical protein